MYRDISMQREGWRGRGRAVCFVLVTSFLRRSSDHFVSPISPLSLCSLSFALPPRLSSLFIISRRKLHLATVQLFPFISFMMHPGHEIDINSGSAIPRLRRPTLVFSSPRSSRAPPLRASRRMNYQANDTVKEREGRRK